MEEKDYFELIKGFNRKKIIILLMTSYIKVLSELDILEKAVNKLYCEDCLKGNSYFKNDTDKLLCSIMENKRLVTNLYLKTKENFIQNKAFL